MELIGAEVRKNQLESNSLPVFLENSVENSIHSSLSSKVWGIQWNRFFPLVLENGCSIELGTYDQAKHFFSIHYKTIYEIDESDPFMAEAMGPEKEKYYRSVGDFFFFKDTNQTVGVFTGTLTDWSSYYFRNCSILPTHQKLGLYQSLLKHLLNILGQFAVNRVEGDVAPSNLGHVHILNKFGFNITGLNLTDRWGSMMHFTKYLNTECESVFLKQFCQGVKPQTKR